MGGQHLTKYILELPHTQDASHHQDYSMFSRESQPKPSYVGVAEVGQHSTNLRALGTQSPSENGSGT